MGLQSNHSQCSPCVCRNRSICRTRGRVGRPNGLCACVRDAVRGASSCPDRGTAAKALNGVNARWRGVAYGRVSSPAVASVAPFGVGVLVRMSALSSNGAPFVWQLGNIAPPCRRHAPHTLTQPPHSSYTARPLPQTTHTRARTRQAGHAVPVTCADRRRRRHRLLPLSLLFTDCDGWWGRWGWWCWCLCG